MSEIIIYTSDGGEVELKVNLVEDSVWLTQKQLSDLFDKNVRTISEHIGNVFREEELLEDSVVRNFRIAAADGKLYDTKHYNLDVIISVGYRVKSKQGTRFRQWATRVLNKHLIQGYTTNKSRLAEQGIKELEQAVSLLQRTLVKGGLVTDLGSETVGLIISYAKTWHLLLAYDEDALDQPVGTLPSRVLTYAVVKQAIDAMKTELIAKQQATELFGRERDLALESILQNIEQTFDGEPVYHSVEQKAAHLLYFVIKDHPFTDGNKRIACFVFLLYLRLQKVPCRLNDNGLAALALLIAESSPQQKDLMIRLIGNLLMD